MSVAIFSSALFIYNRFWENWIKRPSSGFCLVPIGICVAAFVIHRQLLFLKCE
jgi:hypothetical protein